MEDALRIDRDKQKLIALVKDWVQAKGALWVQMVIHEALDLPAPVVVGEPDQLFALNLEQRRLENDLTRERVRQLRLANEARERRVPKSKYMTGLP